jgi:hypothetical protein
MRSAPFNQRISIVNRIAYTVVSKDPKAEWWSTTLFVGDASGSFREFADLPDGRLVRLRAQDGVHFTEEGASTMTAVLMKWLDPSLQSAEGLRKMPPAQPSAPLSQLQQLSRLAVADPESAHH